MEPPIFDFLILSFEFPPGYHKKKTLSERECLIRRHSGTAFQQQAILFISQREQQNDNIFPIFKFKQ